MPLVEARQDDAVLTLRLNRPERLNALDAALRRAVGEMLDRAARNEAVRVVILTGGGERAFCAGQDLSESAALEEGAGPEWMASWRAYFDAFARFPKPIVAAINGIAAGAGLQTALLADIRVAVPGARLLMAEVNVGLPAVVGGHLLAVHVGLSRAIELVLTGREVLADEAATWGIVHEIAPPEALAERAAAVARALADKPPTALRLTMAHLRAGRREGLIEAEEAAGRYQSAAIATGAPQSAMGRFLRRRTGGAAASERGGEACTNT
jgi:enoyl-CoA hydratase/carnithine racemase